MRAVVFLAIVGVALGNLCKGIKQKDINAVFLKARLGATAILGLSCPSFDIDTVVFDGECRNLVRQATCYGIKANDRYDVDIVSYGILEEDVENIEKLGNIACERSRACFDQVKDAIQTCVNENENFLNETIDAAEQAYIDNFEDDVTAFAAGNKGSLLGDLASIALDRFNSADDIRTFIEGQITEEVEEDARIAAEETKKLAQDFCDSGCTSETAQFLKSIFSHLNGGQCVDASKFCGDCKERAESWFARNQLPCCIEKVIQKGIEAYDIIVEKYGDEIDQLSSAIEEQLSDTAAEEAVAINDEFVAEFSCVSEVYTSNQLVCV